jgi:hypothetical protein
MIENTMQVAREKIDKLLKTHETGFVKALQNSEDGRLNVALRVEIELGEEDKPNILVCGITYTTEKMKDTQRVKVDERQGDLFPEHEKLPTMEEEEANP